MSIAIVPCAMSIGYCLATRAADSSLLYSFEQEQELQSIQATHARASRLKHFVTDGHYALQVDFEATDQPQIEFATATKTDWRRFGAIAVDAQRRGQPGLRRLPLLQVRRRAADRPARRRRELQHRIHDSRRRPVLRNGRSGQKSKRRNVSETKPVRGHLPGARKELRLQLPERRYVAHV